MAINIFYSLNIRPEAHCIILLSIIIYSLYFFAIIIFSPNYIVSKIIVEVEHKMGVNITIC